MVASQASKIFLVFKHPLVVINLEAEFFIARDRLDFHRIKSVRYGGRVKRR